MEAELIPEIKFSGSLLKWSGKQIDYSCLLTDLETIPLDVKTVTSFFLTDGEGLGFGLSGSSVSLSIASCCIGEVDLNSKGDQHGDYPGEMPPITTEG